MNVSEDQYFICEQQGEMFRYAHKHKANIFQFAKDFLSSDFCNRSLDSEYSVDQYADILNWEELMEDDCKIIPDIFCKNNVSGEEAEWMGFTYRYVQILTREKSRKIVELIPPEKLILSYEGLHTIDEDLAAEKLINSIKVNDENIRFGKNN